MYTQKMKSYKKRLKISVRKPEWKRKKENKTSVKRLDFIFYFPFRVISVFGKSSGITTTTTTKKKYTNNNDNNN